eukprot:GEMP01033627.1.p1 GENE.GEMP01033627.1~~GEMP01033627.1.p1  ORF type:complete len:421 (+),score=58.67 GEMP01033627.1:118-1380(+)
MKFITLFLFAQLAVGFFSQNYGTLRRRKELPQAVISGDGHENFVKYIVDHKHTAPAPAYTTVVAIEGARWFLGDKLGGGSFGQVYLATESGGSSEDKKVAIKFAAKLDGQYLVTEVERMRKLMELPGVPKLIKSARFDERNQGVMMVMKYYPEGDLLKYIGSKNEPVQLKEMLDMAIDAFENLKNIHQTTRMYHGDIKPHNLFVDESGHIVFGDWGDGEMYSPLFSVKEMKLTQRGDMASLFLSILYLDGTLTDDKLYELRKQSSIFKNWTKVLAQQLRDKGRTVWANIWDEVLKPGPEVPHDQVLKILLAQRPHESTCTHPAASVSVSAALGLTNGNTVNLQCAAGYVLGQSGGNALASPVATCTIANPGTANDYTITNAGNCVIASVPQAATAAASVPQAATAATVAILLAMATYILM